MPKRSWRFTRGGSIFIFLLAAVVIYYGGIFGCGGGGTTNTGGGGNSFTSGGVTLNARTTTSGNSKTVTVTDANGTTVLTLVLTTTSATLSASGQTDAVYTFRNALTSLPTDYTAERMAILVAGGIAVNPDASALPDNPGCDFFPDTQCTLGCCATHDQCYKTYGCNALSWFFLFGDCQGCNDAAVDCITLACAGITESNTANNCYNNICNKFYDCPPNFDNCDCQTTATLCPQTPPAGCGNGKCETGETADNCYADCAMGNSMSECCVTTNDCPGETGTQCGSGCCCCGQGLACGSGSSVDHICVPTP